MTRPLSTAEQRLVDAVGRRMLSSGVDPTDVERMLALAAAELVRHPESPDPDAARVDPRLVARAAAAVARPGLRGHDVTPVRLGTASPSELVRELRRRLGGGRSRRRTGRADDPG